MLKTSATQRVSWGRQLWGGEVTITFVRFPASLAFESGLGNLTTITEMIFWSDPQKCAWDQMSGWDPVWKVSMSSSLVFASLFFFDNSAWEVWCRFWRCRPREGVKKKRVFYSVCENVDPSFPLWNSKLSPHMTTFETKVTKSWP